MLILPNSCFLHVPKTGGTWVKKAIVRAGVDCDDYWNDGTPHVELVQCPCPEKFKFAFVRSPLDLYRSYWQYKMTYGWDLANPMDSACQSDSFERFVRSVLARFPGIYTYGLSRFVGEQGSEIDFIGRYENLVEDLILALTRAGETFDEDAIRSLPPDNVSDKTRYPAEYSEELARKVEEAEREAISRFGYDRGP